MSVTEASEVPMTEEAIAIRKVISDFIQARLDRKLEDLQKEEANLGVGDAAKREAIAQKREGEQEKYRYETWIEDAARRAGRLQVVQFAAKFTHPYSRGSSLHVDRFVEAPGLVGTHLFGNQLKEDAIGNAADLDVYKMLILDCSGRTILDLALESNSCLASALSGIPEKGQELVRSFASIARSERTPTSDALAKQVFFPLEDGTYHLLGPLFPTSLVHHLYQAVNRDRFSEASQGARAARRKEQPCPNGYREYPNLAIRKFGGTKPQNISQLNTERHGESYLLAALPPMWQRPGVAIPASTTSIFTNWFGRRHSVRDLTRTLREFLESTTYNNARIRQASKDLVLSIRDELIQVATELQQHTPGWSANSRCSLDMCESIWLDPRRAASDDTFKHQMLTSDWQGDICSRFARWLNGALKSKTVHLGDAEYQEWRSLLDVEIGQLRQELTDDV